MCDWWENGPKWFKRHGTRKCCECSCAVQLAELTPTLQMCFLSPWELVAEQEWLITALPSNCGSALGFPSWANGCLLCPRHFPPASLVSACTGIYSPNGLALGVGQAASVNLILCLCWITDGSPCWLCSAQGLYNCSLLGCLRTNQTCHDVSHCRTSFSKPVIGLDCQLFILKSFFSPSGATSYLSYSAQLVRAVYCSEAGKQQKIFLSTCLWPSLKPGFLALFHQPCR